MLKPEKLFWVLLARGRIRLLFDVFCSFVFLRVPSFVSFTGFYPEGEPPCNQNKLTHDLM